MKRFATSLGAAAIVPVTVVFVLIAGPARLFAESGVVASCSAPELQACSSKSSGAACQLNGGAPNSGICFPTSCANDDGSYQPAALVCAAPQCAGPEFQVCSAMASGDVCWPDANGPTLRCEPSLCTNTTGSNQSALACSLSDGGGGGSEPIDADGQAPIRDEGSAQSEAGVNTEAGSTAAPDTAAESSVDAPSEGSFAEASGESTDGAPNAAPGAASANGSGGGGCSSAGASPNGEILAAIGLSLTVCLLFLARRRSLSHADPNEGAR